MKNRFYFTAFFSIFYVVLFGQVDSTFQESFISPVKHPMRLSGSFGELRSNHYHTGIDIKGKNSTSGDSIIAVMSGFISRIRVQSGSYGKSIFIDHPNGITTVYAHLKQFSPSIDALIEKKQKEYNSYAIDFYPPRDSILIGQGNFLGLLGNTGRSFGPHLHFECRETISELPVDPLLFDFGVTDHKPPFFQNLILHELDSNYQITHRKFAKPQVSSFTSSSDIVGIGFKGYDQMDGSSNYNGIADIKTYADNKLIFHCSFDTLSFYEMKYINASIDYALKQDANSTYFMCYKLPANKVRNIKKSKNAGLIYLTDDTNVKIVITDRSGNRNVSDFNLIKDTNRDSDSSDDRLYMTGEPIEISRKSIRALINDKTLYKPSKIPLSLELDTNVSHIQVGNITTPCHDYYSLQVTDLSNFSGDKSKLQLYHQSSSGSWTKLGGKTLRDTFNCKVNKFGVFKLEIDEKAPTIEGLQSIKINQDLLFKIKDDTNVSGRAEDLNLHCFLDGIWTPFYYKSLVHILQIDGKYIRPDLREIHIVAVDNVGNRTDKKYRLR